MKLSLIAMSVASLTIFGAISKADPSGKPVDLQPHFAKTPIAPQFIDTDLIVTHESTVTVDGVEFRQIDYEDKRIYLKARQPEVRADCNVARLPRETFAIDGSVKLTKRSRLYLESLRQGCVGGQIVTKPSLRDTNLGISSGGPAPDDPQKKVFINPLKKAAGVGLSF